MNLLNEEAYETAMPDWMPGSRRVRLHDISPAGDIPGRVSARASRHVNRYPAAAGAFGLADDDLYQPSMPGIGRRVAEARRTGVIPALKHRASARDPR
jgi:hypothetical protein